MTFIRQYPSGYARRVGASIQANDNVSDVANRRSAGRSSAHRRIRPIVRRPSGDGGEVKGYAYVILAVAATTAVLGWMRTWLDFGQASLLYLPLVIACAVRFGFGPAVLGAVLSFAAWDFFFTEPLYTFFSNSPQDWLYLFVFLIAAIATAHLAARARDEARAAAAREQETAILYQASYAICREVLPERLLPALVEQVKRLCQAPDCVVIQSGNQMGEMEVVAAAYRGMSEAYRSAMLRVASVVREQDRCVGFCAVTEGAVLTQRTRDEAMEDWWTRDIKQLSPELPDECSVAQGIYIPLHAQGRLVGVFHVGYRTDGSMFSEQEERLILTLANHAAVVIARLAMAAQAQTQAQITAVLDERNRLARDVHDTLSHAFTGFKFLLEAADRVVPIVVGGEGQTRHVLAPQLAECIARARQLAVEGAQEARRSVWALRAAPLEEAGDLPTAVRDLAPRIGADLGIEVETAIAGEPFPMPAIVEDNLLRTCQEALGNALRHAKAAHISIVLAYASDCVTLVIQDDGCGFDPERSIAEGGFGLTSMRQRCERIGAEIVIESARGAGTVVTVRAAVAANIWERVY